MATLWKDLTDLKRLWAYDTFRNRMIFVFLPKMVIRVNLEFFSSNSTIIFFLNQVVGQMLYLDLNYGLLKATIARWRVSVVMKDFFGEVFFFVLMMVTYNLNTCCGVNSTILGCGDKHLWIRYTNDPNSSRYSTTELEHPQNYLQNAVTAEMHTQPTIGFA